MTVNEEIIRQSYLEAGRPDAFNPDDVRFLSDWQFGYTMGCAGIIAREKPAANFLIGYFYAESLILAESGALEMCIRDRLITGLILEKSFKQQGKKFGQTGKERLKEMAGLNREEERALEGSPGRPQNEKRGQGRPLAGNLTRIALLAGIYAVPVSYTHLAQCQYCPGNSQLIGRIY